MFFGLSRSGFTLVHVLLSMAAAGSGFVVVWGLLNRKLLDGWITIFCTTSILTILTGFLFPFDRLLRSHLIGLLSLLFLTITPFVRIGSNLVGAWRAVYVLTLAAALYLDCFVAVMQLFAKIPALRAMAPTQTETPFWAAQCAVLLIFVILTYTAAKRFSVGQQSDRVKNDPR